MRAGSTVTARFRRVRSFPSRHCPALTGPSQASGARPLASRTPLDAQVPPWVKIARSSRAMTGSYRPVTTGSYRLVTTGLQHRAVMTTGWAAHLPPWHGGCFDCYRYPPPTGAKACKDGSSSRPQQPARPPSPPRGSAMPRPRRPCGSCLKPIWRCSIRCSPPPMSPATTPSWCSTRSTASTPTSIRSRKWWRATPSRTTASCGP
jgi:hypothetical protein